jgi:radical SAM protein with 4Fe4S-binding SPASM domain
VEGDLLLKMAQNPERSSSQIYDLDPCRSLAFVRCLSHHGVDGLHLWIGVEEGVLIVLDDKEHQLFECLQNEQPPAQLLVRLIASANSTVQETVDTHWLRINDLVRKLGESGFITGIRGYHDTRTLHPEKFARLHVTRRCQLQCIHCYAASGPDVVGSSELATERWMAIIDDIAECGGESVLFTGGEPLIREDCPRLMRHAKARGLQVTLFTNGLLVEKCLAEFAGQVDLVQVSLNGPDEVSNDAIRGKGTFHKIMEAIRMLLDAGAPVRIGMTVMEKNWPAIRDGFLAFADQFAGAPIQFHLGYGVCTYGRATALEDRLDLEEVRPLLDGFLAAVNGPQGRRITRKTTGCGYCEQLVIAPDGIVYPCHLLDGPLGHIDDRPVHEWHELLEETARAHRVEQVDGCNTCDLRNLCGGTCRVINERVTGSKFITTCSQRDRAARYRNLVRLFYRQDKETTTIE